MVSKILIGLLLFCIQANAQQLPSYPVISISPGESIARVGFNCGFWKAHDSVGEWITYDTLGDKNKLGTEDEMFRGEMWVYTAESNISDDQRLFLLDGRTQNPGPDKFRTDRVSRTTGIEQYRLRIVTYAWIDCPKTDYEIVIDSLQKATPQSVGRRNWFGWDITPQDSLKYVDSAFTDSIFGLKAFGGSPLPSLHMLYGRGEAMATQEWVKKYIRGYFRKPAHTKTKNKK